MKEAFDIKNDLEAFLQIEGMTMRDFALSIGISHVTLSQAIEHGNATPMTLETVYGYIYDHGYRLNNALAEIYAESREKDHLVLYHGAKRELGHITPTGSRPECDFGQGFYLGESYPSAFSFVSEFPFSSIYVFDLDVSGLSYIKYGCDQDWVLSICLHRGYLQAYKDHPRIKAIQEKEKACDLIIAPIADNKMFQIIREFGMGEISVEMAMHALSASSLGKQYVLKSEKAIDNLSLIKRLYLSKPERKGLDKDALERAALIDSKLKIAKRTFREGGTYIEDLFA